MALTRPWQAELRGLTLGEATDYTFAGQISGLGSPKPRTNDQQRGNLDGDVGGDDVTARRVLIIPVNVDQATADDAWATFQALKAAWRSSKVDLPFDLWLPGFPSSDGTLRFFGRPRGIDPDLTHMKSGHIGALLTFEALDPFGYGPEIVVDLDAGANVLIADGDTDTDRYELELDTTAANVTFANASDAEPDLSFHDAEPILLLDGRARTVTAAGLDAYGLINPGSGWPVIVAGENDLTLTGATGILTYRPAFE